MYHDNSNFYYVAKAELWIEFPKDPGASRVATLLFAYTDVEASTFGINSQIGKIP